MKKVFENHGWPNIAIFQRDKCIKAANTVYRQEDAKSTLRWYQKNIEAAEKRGDVKRKEEIEQKLCEGRIKYKLEWGHDPSIMTGLKSLSLE